MKNIALRADEHLIQQTRLLAKSRHKTLNAGAEKSAAEDEWDLLGKYEGP